MMSRECRADVFEERQTAGSKMSIACRLGFRGVLCLLLLAIQLATLPATHAVIVSGNQSGYDTGTGAGSGWDYVGTVSGASGIYLGQYNGNSWVLTAAHVGPGTFTLASTAYSYVANTYVQITGTDLGVFQIAGSLSLPNLTLAATTPAIGSSVTMIGYGRNRAPDPTTWYVDLDTNPYTWSESSFPAPDGWVDGYKWADGQTKRWGTNRVSGTANISYGYGNVKSLYTTFDNTAGEAQGAPGDSGGGVFFNNSGMTELVGLMVTITSYSGQPANTSVYGNQTYAVDIAQYRNQILTVIPEPSTLVLTLIAVPLLFRRRFRQPR
jgi:hypothetical protein